MKLNEPRLTDTLGPGTAAAPRDSISPLLSAVDARGLDIERETAAECAAIADDCARDGRAYRAAPEIRRRFGLDVAPEAENIMKPGPRPGLVTPEGR